MMIVMRASVGDLYQKIGQFMEEVEGKGFIYLPHNVESTALGLERFLKQLQVVVEVLGDPEFYGSTIPQEYADPKLISALSDSFRMWGADFNKVDPRIPDSFVVLLMTEVIKRMAERKSLKMS